MRQACFAHLFLASTSYLASQPSSSRHPSPALRSRGQLFVSESLSRLDLTFDCLVEIMLAPCEAVVLRALASKTFPPSLQGLARTLYLGMATGL